MLTPAQRKKIADVATYRVLPALRCHLFSRKLPHTPLMYATMLRYAEQVATEGALYLLGDVAGAVVLDRHRVLEENGHAEIADVASRLSGLVAASVRGDRAAAKVIGATFANGDKRVLLHARKIWETFNYVAPAKRAAA